MQSMIAINWPLLILTDSPKFPRKLTIAGMDKMCVNNAKVTNKRFDGNWGNVYTRDLPHSNVFLLSEYHPFYLEVNLMPYGFLLKETIPQAEIWCEDEICEIKFECESN